MSRWWWPGLVALAAAGQNPYQVAAEHYHLLFENAWVRASRVTYGPHETAALHQHPATPTTLYVYLTDGGVMRFRHISGENVAGVDIDRKPVRAGAIRFAHGAAETHFVEYLGDRRTEYVRIELRTELVDRLTRDVRLPPVTLSPSEVKTQFENGQIRILRIACGKRCPASAHPADPAVVVTMTGTHRGTVEWSPAVTPGPAEVVRIELKSQPVR